MNRRSFIKGIGCLALAMRIGLGKDFQTPVKPSPLHGLQWFLVILNDGEIVERPIAEHPEFPRLVAKYGEFYRA